MNLTWVRLKWCLGLVNVLTRAPWGLMTVLVEGTDVRYLRWRGLCVGVQSYYIHFP